MKIWAAISSVKSNELNRTKGQAAFYTEALYYFKERDEPNWKDYKILPFKFIVESTVNPGNPLIFTCSDELLKIGREGRVDEYVRIFNVFDHRHEKLSEIKGFQQLIEDYKWYMENEFEKNKKIVESQGEFQLDWNGII